MSIIFYKVEKAIILVAGLGLCMFPATKAIPKGMLFLVDKFLIQFVVNECVASGIYKIIFVTYLFKNFIENHFDTSFKLKMILEKRVKREFLSEVQGICPSNVMFMQVLQDCYAGLDMQFYVLILLLVMKLLQ